jgi:hypothetical protein
MNAPPLSQAMFQGGWVEIDERVLDISRRIREGDELWRGDPNMRLFYNPRTEEYEVIALDAHGTEYVAISTPHCGTNILIQLARTDWQRGAAVYREFRENAERADRERRQRADDARRERFDQFRHALKREMGHHYGGTTRTYFGGFQGAKTNG